MTFKPNRKFKREYDRIFKKDPLAANTLLLLCEIADDRGQVETNPEEIAGLLTARFENPRKYALERGKK